MPSLYEIRIHHVLMVRDMIHIYSNVLLTILTAMPFFIDPKKGILSPYYATIDKDYERTIDRTNYVVMVLLFLCRVAMYFNCARFLGSGDFDWSPISIARIFFLGICPFISFMSSCNGPHTGYLILFVPLFMLDILGSLARLGFSTLLLDILTSSLLYFNMILRVLPGLPCAVIRRKCRIIEPSKIAGV